VVKCKRIYRAGVFAGSRKKAHLSDANPIPRLSCAHARCCFIGILRATAASTLSCASSATPQWVTDHTGIHFMNHVSMIESSISQCSSGHVIWVEPRACPLTPSTTPRSSVRSTGLPPKTGERGTPSCTARQKGQGGVTHTHRHRKGKYGRQRVGGGSLGL
jgi:hypothetical protein